MTPWLDDGDVRLMHGDALEQLALMPSESVQCIVTSPPFWGLRDYGTGEWIGGDAGHDHDRVGARGGRGGSGAPGKNTIGATPATLPVAECSCGARYSDPQIGLEETPDEWCARLVAVFREARRVLRNDGVCWIEVGDTYASSGERATGRNDTDRETPGGAGGSFRGGKRESFDGSTPGLKPKDLVGAPWLLAFALRADGWYLRSDTIWARPNTMPESVTDRPTKAHSYVFLLTKSARYFYDADAIREEAQYGFSATNGQPQAARRNASPNDQRHDRAPTVTPGDGTGGRNARSVWSIATEPTPFAHFATFPQALVERCVKAGTSEHGACSECGAPWRRITERTIDPHQKTWNVRAGSDGNSRAANHQRDGMIPGTPSVTTTGWEASCDHDAPVTPCLVLDCFMGSGTTALVARRLGRHAWGIELNASYLEIAAKRLQQLSLLA